MRERKERQERRSPRWRRWCCDLIGGCVLLVAGPALAAEISVTLSDETSYYVETLASLRKRLGELRPDTTVSAQSDFGTALAKGGEADLLVTIGSKAAGEARTVPVERSVLHLFVTRDDWQRDLAGVPGLARRSALVLDQPLRHQVALTRALLPKANTLAIVLGPVGRRHIEAVRDEAEASGFEPLIDILDINDNPLTVLSPLVRASDAVLVLPDTADFNSAVAKWLLQLSFRARVPVIAFSSAYVRAGALAAVFTAPQDVGRDGAELIAAGLAAGELAPGVRAPRSYSIAINQDVAKALGIDVSDEATYRQQIDAMLERKR